VRRFALLVYKMSKEGSYSTLASKCAYPADIKKAFLHIGGRRKRERVFVWGVGWRSVCVVGEEGGGRWSLHPKGGCGLRPPL
jgi:hypothetical protein